MVAPTRPPANAFVKAVRRVYNPIGFSKGYNFVLFFITAGAMTGFCLARLQYLDYNGIFCKSGAMPGECFYAGHGYHQVGLWLHLASVLPAGLLACVQFVPVIRHKWILVHRINGYIVNLLSLTSIVSALMITRRSFGGSVSSQTSLGLASLLFLGAIVMGYINIKRLQIEEHRKWMLRAWVYAGTIITARIIGILSTMISSISSNYYVARPCEQIDWMLKHNQTRTLLDYPECAAFYDGSNLDKHAVVASDYNSGRVVEIGASLTSVFGGAIWLGLFIHFIGVEIYLHLTPREHNRLRNVSYNRQLEAGMKNPGRAGLTVDRFGDADYWVPDSMRKTIPDTSEKQDVSTTESG